VKRSPANHGVPCGRLQCFYCSDLDMEEHVAGLVAKFVELKPEWRARFLHEASEVVCMLCGNDAKCYCAPCYDE